MQRRPTPGVCVPEQAPQDCLSRADSHCDRKVAPGDRAAEQAPRGCLSRADFPRGRKVALALLLALAVTLATGALPFSSGPLAAQEEAPAQVAVVTSGGLAAAYDRLAPRFETETGIGLVTAYGASTGGAPDSIPIRLARGERFDVLIMSQAGLDALAAQGLVRPATRRDLASSSIGMAVRDGAPLPDISTPEAFAVTLLDAESIGYSASVSGTYISTELFPRLGLAEQLAPKSRRIVSERVAAVVARGEVEIGFQQVSEILSIDGAAYAGPIPDEYQRVTTFSTGIATDAENPVGAQKLIDFLSSDAAARAIAESGLQPAAGQR